MKHKMLETVSNDNNSSIVEYASLLGLGFPQNQKN